MGYDISWCFDEDIHQFKILKKGFLKWGIPKYGGFNSNMIS